MPEEILKILERIRDEMDDCGCGEAHRVRFTPADLETIRQFLETTSD